MHFEVNSSVYILLNTIVCGQAQWLMSIIPAFRKAEVGGSSEVRSLTPAWPTWGNTICTKNTRISPAWWWALVIAATWKVEAGESLEPARLRLRRAKTASLHSSLGSKSEPLSQ